jgi:hypothetical protein
MGLPDAEAERYAHDLVQRIMEPDGNHRVIDQLIADLKAAGKGTLEDLILFKLHKLEAIAKREVMEA